MTNEYGLTDRERWLMARAFTAGFLYGALKEPALFGQSPPHLDDWLSEDAADGVVVGQVLAKEAPEAG